MINGGEGGLGVNIGFVTWEPRTFDDYKEALDFFKKHKEATDGYIHPGKDGKSVIIFTRKENT